MEKNNEIEEEIGIRLILSKDYDQPLFDYFMQIKKNLGLKTNTEVARICIKKAFEYWFDKEFKYENFNKEFKNFMNKKKKSN